MDLIVVSERTSRLCYYGRFAVWWFPKEKRGYITRFEPSGPGVIVDFPISSNHEIFFLIPRCVIIL